MDRVAAEVAEEVGVLLQHHTSIPARASRKPSIIPAGPPPAMQQVVRRDRGVWGVSVMGGTFSFSRPSCKLPAGFPQVSELGPWVAQGSSR